MINIDHRVTCVKADTYPSQVSSNITGLILNRDYIIYGIKRSPCCGALLYDVGLVTEANDATCKCGQNYHSYDTADWKLAERFAKKEEKTIVSYVKEELELMLN